MPPSLPSVSGVLLIGSVPLPSTSEVFNKLTSTLPQRLASLPDGEPGSRQDFILWERSRFPPETLKYTNGGINLPDGHSGVFTQDDVSPTDYGAAAVESWRFFCEYRERGVIPTGVRFQVSLPLPWAVIAGHVRPEFHAMMEPLYTRRMEDAVRIILDNIPAGDLAIQLDLAREMLALEYERGRLGEEFRPHFAGVEGILEGVLHRIQRFASLIPEDVDLGLHFCYGDRDHRHYVEPEDLGVAVGFANANRERLRRRIAWMHLPVPKDRADKGYFEPLRKLILGVGTLAETKLYLGLVHANDEEGTRRRIEAALSTVRGFGVATECGLGRTPTNELDSILSISREVSAPV
ncbi:uncharacterized protein N7496_007648 [Penicillium cataractarum]|uniref:Uncharacterized protein n=1 Tax=Penicillium cataractarum TaxID=2100454 RepID=A0A9W9S1M8_9EURO|nr:uncharacterized protein N7496_007648 [Penicillium cataractarum]KAJ5367888.1 hypothetical protein N7496_007648 [Penicillium cataractarum]